jgi:hypothetical protein
LSDKEGRQVEGNDNCNNKDEGGWTSGLLEKTRGKCSLLPLAGASAKGSRNGAAMHVRMQAVEELCEFLF